MIRQESPRSSARTLAPVGLDSRLDKRLANYATAATAAGVAMLALTKPAEARIIYTPANERIVYGTTVDLNHDGINDLVFHTSYHYGSGSFHYLAAAESRRDRVVGQGSYASALKAGMPIGPTQQFVFGRAAMAAWSGNNGNHYRGQWINGGKGVKNRYLGLQFVIHGRIHYGWARITVTPTRYFKGTLTGYAYETVAKKSIKAGQKKEAANSADASTLGHLAQGASGFVAWTKP
jgi:hypothetical protein